MATKIRARRVIFNHDPHHPDDMHIVIVDRKDRVWERYSKMPPGKWVPVELPDEPEPRRPRRVSKLAR